MSIVNEIERIKTNISNAYDKAEEKGAVLPEIKNSDNLPEVIESITSGSSEDWQPQPDWWDIDKILEEDEEEYPAKVIALVTDEYDTSNIYDERASKIRTSDDTEYTKFNVIHTWDKTKDKPCSLGYKTRYLIYYYSDVNKEILASFPKGTIYAIFENFTNRFGTYGYGITRYNQDLIAMKFKNCKLSNIFNIKHLIMDNNFIDNITDINSFYNITVSSSNSNSINFDIYNKIDFNKVTNFAYAFRYLKQYCLNIPNTQNVTNWTDCFAYSQIKYINSLDFESAINVGSIFYSNGTIINIGEVKNIKINGFDFGACTKLNHDTLIRILEALYDYSDGDTHTIKLGSTNLAKLTPEELAIGQNKNWTIS